MTVHSPAQSPERSLPGDRPLPAVFVWLAEEKNLAVGAALVEAFPELEPSAQLAAMRMLGEREHRACLAELVGRFLTYDAPQQQLLIARVNDVFAGFGGAMQSPVFEYRQSAVEFIVRSNSGRLAYLLADALHGKCPKTRELAAEVLRRMVGQFLDAATLDGQAVANPARHAEDLADALRKALLGWELHHQPKALEAALWMPDRMNQPLSDRLGEPRGKTALAIRDVLEGANDPKMAPFALRALAYQPVRAVAARAIGRATASVFRQRVVQESWVLVDRDVARGCRRIRESSWIHADASALLELDDALADRTVRFLMSTGGPKETKYARLLDLLRSDRPALRRAVVWHLVDDESERSAPLLHAATQYEDTVCIARRELDRRLRRKTNRERLNAPASQVEASEDGKRDSAKTALENLWSQFEQLDAEARAADLDKLRGAMNELVALLQSKLSSDVAEDRARALRVIRAGKLDQSFSADVLQLASDGDPLVRSEAVSLLARSPGVAGMRILRQATHDPDPRVQANAIEALDQLNATDRAAWTESKLKSPHARVRANAVKSLLRLDLRQAGEALFDMLEHSDRSHRVSALWVVERLNLRSLLEHIVAMEHHDPDPNVRKRATRLIHALKPASKAAAVKSHEAGNPINAKEHS